MTMNAEVDEISRSDVSIADVSIEERLSHELAVRIVKLRWMGMEEEAERIAASLRRFAPGCVLPAGPVDTD